MRIVLGLAVGYVVGAKTGSKDFDQVVKSLRALRESDEFADLMAAVRAHVGHTLREVANALDGSSTPEEEGDDLVDRVRQLFGTRQ